MIKELLTSAPVHVIPEGAKPLVVYTNAYGMGLDMVLM